MNSSGPEIGSLDTQRVFGDVQIEEVVEVALKDGDLNEGYPLTKCGEGLEGATAVRPGVRFVAEQLGPDSAVICAQLRATSIWMMRWLRWGWTTENHGIKGTTRPEEREEAPGSRGSVTVWGGSAEP